MMPPLAVTFYPPVRMNPYLRILAGGLEALGATVRFGRGPRGGRAGGEVLHLHWVEGIALGRLARRSQLAMQLAFAAMHARVRGVRRRGGAVIWTAHNLRPHERSGDARDGIVDRWLARIYGEAHAVVCMSDVSAGQVAALHPALADRITVIRHPHYGDHYRDLDAPAALPEGLAVPAGATVLAMAGIVRPYKRVPETIAAFRAIAREGEWLLVAGACYDPALEAAVRAAAGDHPRIRIAIGELDDDAYAALVARADAVLVMQDRLMNSGMLISALSVGTPAIAIDLPANREVAGLVGPEWVPLIAALDPPALRTAIDGLGHSLPGPPDLAAFDPGHVARAHHDLYLSALSLKSVTELA